MNVVKLKPNVVRVETVPVLRVCCHRVRCQDLGINLVGRFECKFPYGTIRCDAVGVQGSREHLVAEWAVVCLAEQRQEKRCHLSQEKMQK